MKVDDIPAGPRLDVLVAEKVMGWKRTNDLTEEEVAAYVKEAWQSNREPTREDIHRQRIRWIVGGECDCADWMRPDGLPVTEVPRYSTDIKAAWQVVEKCRENGFVVYIDEFDSTDPHEWVVCFSKGSEGSFQWFDGCAGTVTLAICRAALKAIGISEVPDEG